MDTRYLLMELPSGGMLSWDLPLEDVSVSVSLTAPTVMGATITHERPELVGLLKPYHVAIFADDGSELHGGILTDAEVSGDKLSLTVAGYAYAPTGQPWTGSEYAGEYVDPLDVVRRIWDRLQAVVQGSGNLHLELDETRSKVTVGEPERDVEFATGDGQDVSFQAGPYRLTAYGTNDLGKEVSDLFEAANASYLERHWWDEAGTLRHRLQIDCPVRSVRRDDVRLVVSENIIVPPKLSLPGTGYSAEVIVQGAGEGRDMITATSGPVDTGGLYRATVYSDKSITTKKKAQTVARQMVKKLSGLEEQITELTVLDHPNADLSGIHPGDVVRVTGDTQWIELDQYVKVIEKSFDPSDPHTGTLAVEAI